MMIRHESAVFRGYLRKRSRHPIVECDQRLPVGRGGRQHVRAFVTGKLGEHRRERVDGEDHLRRIGPEVRIGSGTLGVFEHLDVIAGFRNQHTFGGRGLDMLGEPLFESSPFATMSSASRRPAACCAESSKECGSAPAAISVTTSRWSPAISETTSPRMFVVT